MRTTAFRLATCSIAMMTMIALASQASAQDARSSSVGRTRAAKILATLPNTFVPGVCTATTTPTDFSMECPSGNCGCYTFNGTITGSLVSKGTAAFKLNADLGLPAAPTTSTNGSSTCSPVFGTITTNTTTGRGKRSTPVTTVFNVVGAMCIPLANNGSGSLNGGYGILSQDVTPALSGFGSMIGKINPKGSLIIEMKGPAS
jgi:hypothetical protein